MNLPILSHLLSIKGVASAFVFNHESEILAREVPEKYANEGLRQVATHMIRAAQTLPNLQEYRLGYENFGLWLRSFGPERHYYLAAFLEREADPLLFRQPLNLAVLNLEKAIHQLEEESQREKAQSDTFRAAQAAEQALFSITGEDTNQFFSRFGLLTTYFLGPVGTEMMQHKTRELGLTLPITETENMRSLARTCAELLKSKPHQDTFLNQSEDLIQQTALSVRS